MAMASNHSSLSSQYCTLKWIYFGNRRVQSPSSTPACFGEVFSESRFARNPLSNCHKIQSRMVLESIVICVDNSEYMRNEDFLPDRMRAQIDAVQVVLYAKLRSSPENYLSLVTMANNQVLTNMTNQEAKLLSDLHKMGMEGCIRLLPSLNVAQLVLKHRPIKHAKCRIIVFVGSPVVESENDFVSLGKKFKKENVTVDIVTFGCEPGAEVLRSLVNTLNGATGTNSSFHVVPANLVLSDYVVSSGLVAGHREFGGMPDDVDEDEELRRAIEWSMLESGGQSTIPPPTAQPTGIQDGNDLSDDEQLRIAIQLSIQEAERMEAMVQVPQQITNTRTNSPNVPEEDGPTGAAKPDSTSSTNTTDPNAHLADATSNNSKQNKESNSPSNANPNNTNNNNPNNNHNNAAAAPSNNDSGKTAADNKEAKKTILTKKR